MQMHWIPKDLQNKPWTENVSKMRISNDKKSTSHTSNMEKVGNELHLKPGKKSKKNGKKETITEKKPRQKGIEKKTTLNTMQRQSEND